MQKQKSNLLKIGPSLYTLSLKVNFVPIVVFSGMQVASRACPAMVAQLRCAAAAAPTAATATSNYFLASLLHSSSPPLGQAAKTKSALAKLRKKTGYSLSLCKQALEANEQDVARAQEWLKVGFHNKELKHLRF